MAWELLHFNGMGVICLKCNTNDPGHSRFGFYFRKSDRKRVQRYKCQNCGALFSDETFNDCYRQKKRKINSHIYQLLCSGVSQRRAAILLKVNRKTIVRKFLFLAYICRLENLKQFALGAAVAELQFDDLETFEHTKLKPLSVTMAVESPSRRILGFSVSQMPAKGLLVRKSKKKYGVRPDCRGIGRSNLFELLTYKVNESPLLMSDSNPHYPNDVKKYFPKCNYKTVIGGRGAIVGQGELKKLAFDPLFTLNHTFAMLRANINRLFRKTWCTTKKLARLRSHIDIYVHYHNNFVLNKLAN